MRSTRAAVTVLGGSLALAVGLTGCASQDDGAGSGRSVPAPATTTVTATAAAISPAASPAASAGSSTDSPAAGAGGSGGTDLSARLLTRRDLPAGYETGGMDKIDPSELNSRVRTCVGLSPSTGGVVVRNTTPTYTLQTTGIASTAAGYRTQQAVAADAAVLESPKAKKCLKSAVINQFAGGSATDSATIEVRPGTNDGPANEAGVVGVDFVVDEDGRGSRQTVSVSIFYLTGPKVLSQLIAVAYGQELDADLLTGPLLSTMARRTAQA